jgi:hypothetical protein
MLVATYRLEKQKSICSSLHYGLALTLAFPSSSLLPPEFPCSLTKLCVQCYRYIFEFEVGRNGINASLQSETIKLVNMSLYVFINVSREEMRETKDERKLTYITFPLHAHFINIRSRSSTVKVRWKISTCL